MLRHLSVRDVVLIDQLDLEFDVGLGVLTGETGAGKSILLDALGLALGERGDSGLVRRDAAQATITASFEVPVDHAACALLREQALSDENGTIVLRRVLGNDGRSRAFVNDQPISVGLQRQIGETLVEIHGQFDSRGLLDPATHLTALDAFADLAAARGTVAAAYGAVTSAREALEAAETQALETRAQEEELRLAVNELEQLAPQRGEEATLAGQREMMQHAEQLLDALGAALVSLTGNGETERDSGGAEMAIQRAMRDLERMAGRAGGRFDGALAALDRGAAEIAEAVHALNATSRDIDADPATLEQAEERLFALRAAARKYGVGVDELPHLLTDLSQRLTGIADAGDRLAKLARTLETARRDYAAAAESLSKQRRAAARSLDAAVARELPPLRLDKAQFATRLDRLPETAWGPAGIDRVTFVVATNPGSAPGPLNRIASGGELSRFMLALKVVLSAGSGARVLIFDEVDAGVGGATAAAVGERLARLSNSEAGGRQVLVVTHSPQVAAVGSAHWHVSKEELGKGRNASTATRVVRLDAAARREEIARMLAGAAVTDEARAAAGRLLDASGPVTAPARATG